MLHKSLVTPSDVIIYDLEDSVAPSEEGKTTARERLTEFLAVVDNPSMHSMTVTDHLLQKTPADELPHPSRIAVRVNSTHTPFFERDIVSIVSPALFVPERHSER